MSAELISILVLAVVFVIATTRSINMGVLSFAANAREVDRDAFFRQLLVYGGIMVAVVPAVVWLVFIVPGLG